MPRARSYRLTPELVAAHSGGPVVCLAPRAVGLTHPLFAKRPGPESNTRWRRHDDGRVRADVITPDGGVLDITPAGALDPSVTRVDIRGPIEQRAGFHSECGGWADGHDAITERMTMALAEGDVVMVIDSPGGAHSGLQEAIRRVLEAKAEYGRHVVAYCDEMIGSAAFWWAAAVADEIYLPESGVIGSIGARSAHCSIAGALAQQGVEQTYFAWPGPGKVAFAPELPLSDTGKERGERDVSLAGEAFAAAVGAARGLSRDAIVALDADALTGQAAVDAGLADGVASLEDVMSYALSRASGVTAMADEDDTKAEDAAVAAETEASESYEKVTRERYESDDEPEADDEADGDEDEDDDEEEDAKAKAEDPPAPPQKKQPPPPMKSAAAKLDRIVATNASRPALKSALMPYVQFAEEVFALTGTSSIKNALGALKANAEDAAASGELRTRLTNEKRKRHARERMDLLRNLASANIPGYTRGELFVDDVDESSGKRTGMKPNPRNPVATSPLPQLRSFVDSKLKNKGVTSARRTTPFDADPKAAKEAKQSTDLSVVQSNPVVESAAQRSYASKELLAAAYAAAFPEEVNHGAGA